MIQFPEQIVEKYKDFKPAYQKVYLIIRDSIFYGEVTANEKFTEESVAEALHISRTPVRTALANLRNEGILQNVTKTKTGILEFTKKEKLDLLELNGLLEGRAAYLAAKHGVSEEDLATLVEINNAIGSYKVMPDSLQESGVRDLQMQFHLLIAKLSGNRFLYKEIVETRNILRTLKSELVYTEERRGSYSSFIAPMQEKIIKAIRNREPEEAQLYMKLEVLHAKELYENSSVDLRVSLHHKSPK